MNPSLGRFVVDHRCNVSTPGIVTDSQYLNQANLQNVGVFNDTDGNLAALEQSTGRRWCAPNHANFKRLINQWGFVVAPSAMHSARTTGYGGFHLSIESMYTQIDNDADYWKLGSRGPRDPSDDQASVANASPAGMMQLYSAKVRKSFGFGLELTTAVGFLPETTILTGGADVRMSLLEGFRTGALGIFPDIAVGGGVRTITGTPEFQLTTAGLDAQISKPITIASASRLTPWVGYQYLWIFGDSGLIDTTPGTDPLGYCGYSGQNAPGNPDPSKQVGNRTAFDGQPVCTQGGSPIDFNNNIVFDNARLERQRLLVGLNYRYEMVMFGAQFITDIVDPADAQVGEDSLTQADPETGQDVTLSDEEVLDGIPRQWSLVFELGAMF